MKNKHLPEKVVFGVVVVILAIFGAVYYLGNHSNTVLPGGTPQPTDIPKVLRPPITTSGEISCLPPKDTGGGVTLECAMGLKAENGKFYSLIGISDEEYMNGELADGSKITVAGVLNSTPSDKYDTAGTITVKNWEQMSDVTPEK